MLSLFALFEPVIDEIKPFVLFGFIKGTSVAINKHEPLDRQESVPVSCLTAEANHSSA